MLKVANEGLKRTRNHAVKFVGIARKPVARGFVPFRPAVGRPNQSVNVTYRNE